MLKSPLPLKDLEQAAAERMGALLREIPFLSVDSVEREPGAGPDVHPPDLVYHVRAHGEGYRLVCEVKSSGQPRHVRAAVAALRYYTRSSRRAATGVVIAPYLSAEAQRICRDEDVGFLDFEGNCRLVFDGVFIERSVPPRPPAERRELKSIFAPKSAQVLRVLLRNPPRSWRVAELAEVSGVSLGHASNIRTALIDREWADTSASGLVLTKPDALLDTWRDAYEGAPGKRLAYYTVLHGNAFEQALRPALGAANAQGEACLASFSAAHWLAPFARTGSQYFYADAEGLDVLRDQLRLSSATKGENVVIVQPDHHGVFRDVVEPSPGITCTSPVQTYLDLCVAGERGKEAAEYLRAERLKWDR